jgi:hypothetical protein
MNWDKSNIGKLLWRLGSVRILPLNTSTVISGIYRRKLFSTRLNLGNFGDFDVLHYSVFISR